MNKYRNRVRLGGWENKVEKDEENEKDGAGGERNANMEEKEKLKIKE